MIGWRDLPENHHFGWSSRDEKERLEENLEEVRAKLEVGEKDLSEEDLEESKERLSKELEKEREALEHQKKVLKEAAEEAKQFNRENNLLTPEEAQKIDSFHYVHSQVWFPIIDEIYELKENLEDISRSSVEVDHPADAYNIPRSEYKEITGELEDPLARFVAVGGGEDEIRKRVTKELKENLVKSGSISKDDADRIVNEVSGNLYWKKQDEYIADNVEDLMQHVPEEASELIKKQTERILVGKEIDQEVQKILEEHVDDPDYVSNQLRNMQKNLQKKSRGRLITSLRKPEETDHTNALTPVYKRDWLYELSIAWDEFGEPGSMSNESVHSRLGKIAVNIDRNYYTGKALLKKDLVELMKDLGVETNKFRYWGSRYGGTKIKNPIFPIPKNYEGRLYGTILEGKTHWAKEKDAWVFEYSQSKNTFPVRKEALQKLKLGEPMNTENTREVRLDSMKNQWETSTEKEKYEEARYTIPSMLKDLTKSRNIDIDEINDERAVQLFENQEKIAEGYIAQSFWDRGIYVRNQEQQNEIIITPKNPDLFEKVLDSLELYHGRANKADGTSNIYIPENKVEQIEGELGESLREFKNTYKDKVPLRT